MKLMLALLMAIGFSFSAVAAEEFPTIGLLFNTKESSSLTYDCVLGKDDKLRCDFLQTSIRKKQVS